jgi:hypothetical protein
MDRHQEMGKSSQVIKDDIFTGLPTSQVQSVLEYNGCAHLTIDNIAILSPNHRSKAPPSTLTLTDNDYGSKP